MKAASKSWFERHYFLLRRLHSLTGIVPIGLFLIGHIVTNSSLAWGYLGLRPGEAIEHKYDFQGGSIAYFQKEVAWINTSIPHLILLEVTIWAALIYHSVFGVYYALSGKTNTSRYAYQSNWRYSLQRLSGYVGIFFILYHVATLRWGWTWLVPGGTQWSHHFSASTLAAALRGSSNDFTTAGILVSLFYFLGITLTVFHFANGLWTAAITWGVTVTAKAQRQWGYACFATGVALMLGAWSALGAALIVSPERARAIEQATHPKPYSPESPTNPLESSQPARLD